MNNPLNLTDPSGFSWISKAWKKAWKSPIFKAILGIVVAVVAPYALTWLAPTLFAASSLPLALATGALSGFASTGTLKGALTGAFTAGVMFGVGTISADLTKAGVGGFTDGGIGKIALHAGAGCLSSVAGGGECKTGAMSGGFGEFANNIPDSGIRGLEIAKSAMLGGVGSKLSGGKFSDGAVTGAFGYLFNKEMHVEGSTKCGGNTCTSTEYKEVPIYTAEMKTNWQSFDSDNPANAVFDIGSILPSKSLIRPLEFKLEVGNQSGEILHRARIDKQMYEVVRVDSIEVSRRPTDYVKTSDYKFVSSPSGADNVYRKNMNVCVAGICNTVKR